MLFSNGEYYWLGKKAIVKNCETSCYWTVKFCWEQFFFFFWLNIEKEILLKEREKEKKKKKKKKRKKEDKKSSNRRRKTKNTIEHDETILSKI